jgi:hypothetical protein
MTRGGIWSRTAVALVASLAACGGGGDRADPRILEAGQLDIRLPEGFTVVDGTVVVPVTPAPPARPTAPSPAPAEAAGPPAAADTTAPGAPADPPPTQATDTIPLADNSDPATDFFEAFGQFRGCLDGEGVSFIGVPSGADPNSPANDPAYIEALQLCAARSNILEAMQSAQSAQDQMTPEQIEESNQAYLAWRDCMIDRGWGIPDPVPDAEGRLFSFGAQSGGPQFDPPPGQDVFTTDDISECAAQAGESDGG